MYAARIATVAISAAPDACVRISRGSVSNADPNKTGASQKAQHKPDARPVRIARIRAVASTSLAAVKLRDVRRLTGYFVTTVKSSNCVTESAFVHTPTLPAFENVASSTSYSFEPLKDTSNRRPMATTRNVLH